MTTNECNKARGLDLRALSRSAWGVPALAVVMFAGSTNALAQDAEFGLLDAIEESAAQAVGGQAQQPAPEPVDFSDLEGSVQVNEYDLVDLHVNNEDLGAVLQLLSIQSQRNIISSNSVEASVTADLYGVTFYEALDAILHVNGFGYIEKGNFIYVYTREELEEFERLSRKPISRVIHLDYLNATDAAAFAKSMLSESGSITASAESGQFQIQDGTPSGADTYANGATIVIHDFEENVEQVSALIAELDTKPAQVLIEATILQTTLNEANAFGVDFAVISDLNFGDFLGSGGPLSVVDGLINGTSQDVSGADVPAAGTDGDGIGIGSNIGNVAGPSTLKVGVVSDDVSVFLRVLDQVTDVTVVSNPKLLTLNRQPARVLVGTRVGYLNTTTTDTATTQTVEFLDVGTQLAVRPFVSKNGLIRLELRPQVSNFALRQVTDSSSNTVTIPDEDTTEMNTNVMLRDGQTAVLGGLFTESTTSTRRQVPVLGDIPLIGAAFRGNDDETRRSEIIFLITPSIVNDEYIAEAGALGQDYLDQARVGARRALLPFSRERQVGQLLIKARTAADEGNTERALFLVDRALTLSPMSPDARMMKAELTNKAERMPSRSMINGMLHRELLNGESRVMGSNQPATFEPSTETETPATEDTYAEVPTGPLSSDTTSEVTEEFFEQVDPSWVTAEVETVEDPQFMSFNADSGYEPDPAFTDEPYFVQINPEDMLPGGTAPATASAGTNPAAGTQNTRFDAMKQVATAEPASEPTALPEDWYRWGDSTNPTNEFTSNDFAFGGFLVIPLPGGGALHVDWPVSNWDMPATFTNVPTDSFEPGVE